MLMEGRKDGHAKKAVNHVKLRFAGGIKICGLDLKSRHVWEVTEQILRQHILSYQLQ